MSNDQGAHLRAQPFDIGDGLAGAFATLHRSPEPSSCEELAIRLQGAARHVMRLREALQHPDKVDDQ